MQIASRTILLLGVVLFACNGLWGCKAGRIPISGLRVTEIEGDSVLKETTWEFYSVYASGDTGITYQWSCDPPDAGVFIPPKAATTWFIASEVYEYENVKAEIRIVVNSNHFGPELRSKNITILNRHGWARTWGGTDYDYGFGVAVDNSGNVYVTGQFQSTVDFDPGPGTEEYTAYSYYDIFLSKFDSSGFFQWARTWDGDVDTGYLGTGNEVAVDDFGDVYVIGQFRETVDFDPGPGTDEHTSNGSDDAFISKFDANGDFLWVRTWGGTETDCVYGVTLDDSGIYTTGRFRSTVDFDPGPGTAIHTSYKGTSDVFLSKFDLNGDFQWFRAWGGDDLDYGYGNAVDDSGSVYVTGIFHDTIDLDPGPEVEMHYGGGAFLSKFGSMGNFKWGLTWDKSRGYSVATDGSGNVYVIGRFNGTVDFDPGSGIDEHTSNGYYDVFLNKFDSSGNFQWAHTWGGDNFDFGYGVAVDDVDNIYITGTFRSTTDFDPGPGIDEQTPNGGYYQEPFLTKFDSNGEHLWARIWGCPGSDYGKGVAVDKSGNAYVIGQFGGGYGQTVDFDPGPGVDEKESNGGGDVFLSKFPPDGNW